MTEITLDASVENLDRVLAFIDEGLEVCDCPMKMMTQIDVAVEELFVNIAQYAYAPGVGSVTVGLELCGEPRRIEVTFTDRGVPYDPLAHEDPDVTLSAEERCIGGLGIHMAKKLMDEMSYEYRNGQNILRIGKRL